MSWFRLNQIKTFGGNVMSTEQLVSIIIDMILKQGESNE